MRDTLMRENFKSDNSRKIDKDGACVHELEASVSDLLSSSSGVQTRQLCTKQTPPKNVKETRKTGSPNNEMLNVREKWTVRLSSNPRMHSINVSPKTLSTIFVYCLGCCCFACCGKMLMKSTATISQEREKNPGGVEVGTFHVAK